MKFSQQNCAKKPGNRDPFNHWSTALILHITNVNYLSDYTVSVSFNNGQSGVADLSSVVHQGVFKTLASHEKFAQVGLDAEMQTLVWPGGLDLAPEFVYFQAFKDEPQYQSQFKAWGYVS